MNGSLAPDQNAFHGLVGRQLPNVALTATDGASIALAMLSGLTVIYAYPRTSPPDGGALPGWETIPGAKGCTPQSCAFRDHHAELRAAGASHIFGLSTQSTAYQQEVVARLHLPFALLSDEGLNFQRRLNLPVFDAGGMTLLHRLTLIASNGKVERVFHPILEPAANAVEVLNYLRAR